MQPLRRCLSRGLGYSGDEGDERRRSEICSRKESFLLIGRDGMTDDAIVRVGTRAELTRMGNGECLPRQEQRYGEP